MHSIKTQNNLLETSGFIIHQISNEQTPKRDRRTRKSS